MCSHTESVWGRADRDFFFHQKKIKITPKPKTFLIKWKFPWEASAFFGEYSTKVFWLLSKLKKMLSSKFFSTPRKVCLLGTQHLLSWAFWGAALCHSPFVPSSSLWQWAGDHTLDIIFLQGCLHPEDILTASPKMLLPSSAQLPDLGTPLSAHHQMQLLQQLLQQQQQQTQVAVAQVLPSSLSWGQWQGWGGLLSPSVREHPLPGGGQAWVGTRPEPGWTLTPGRGSRLGSVPSLSTAQSALIALSQHGTLCPCSRRWLC